MASVIYFLIYFGTSELTKNLYFDLSGYHDLIDDLCNFFIKKNKRKIKIIFPLPIVAYCGIKGEFILCKRSMSNIERAQKLINYSNTTFFCPTYRTSWFNFHPS